MPKLSISESARRAGVARSTLYEYYIKPGKISVEVDGRGNKVIDVAELLRVFGELKGGPIQADSGDGHAPDESGHGRTVALDDARQLAGQVLQLKTELDAVRQNKRIVLLGLRRHDSLGLLSRLAHDTFLTESLCSEAGKEIDERDWIFCGSTPPALSALQTASVRAPASRST